MGLLRQMLLYFVASLTLGMPAEARFLREDGAALDDDTAMGSEYYNDEISYEFPLWLARRFRRAQNGVRLGAGSYNASRFQYIEELKASTPDTEPVRFAIQRRKSQRLVEERNEGLVEIAVVTPQKWGVAIFADGDGNKEYGDLGIGLHYDLGYLSSITIRQWSVDHFYNTKTEEQGARYLTKPQSTSAELTLFLTPEDYVHAFVEYDAPLRRLRPLEGETYTYLRLYADGLADIQLREDLSLLTQLTYEQKEEAFSYATITTDQAMTRKVWHGRLGAEWRRRPYESLEAGIGRISRRVNYDYPYLVIREPLLFRTLDDYHLDEDYLYLLLSHHYLRSRFVFTYGLYLNRLQRLIDDVDHGNFESKFRLSFDYIAANATSLTFNTGWDIDQLQRGFPYRERPFRPWGGGNIQFQFVF